MYNRGIHLEKKKKQYQPIHFLVTFLKKERILQRADSVSARYINPHNLHKAVTTLTLNSYISAQWGKTFFSQI